MDAERTFRAGEPLHIGVPCAGLAPGAAVQVKVFEPHGLGGDPVETLSARVDDDGGLASVDWTYDPKKYASRVSRSLFVFVVEGAGRVSISPAVEFVERLEAVVRDDAGHVAAERLVVLHSARGEDIETATNAEGKLAVDVPPGDYHLELKGPAPPDLPRPPLAAPADAKTAAAPVPARAATDGGPSSPSGGGDEESVEDVADDDSAPAAEAAAAASGAHFLSVRFFCRAGRTPVAGKKFEVAGREGVTDDAGRALLTGVACAEHEVHFEGGGTAIVPSVHDQGVVLAVRLRFVEPGDGAPPSTRGTGDASGPANLFPAGDVTPEEGADAAGASGDGATGEAEPPPAGDTHAIALDQL